jgi:hypothetical protein
VYIQKNKFRVRAKRIALTLIELVENKIISKYSSYGAVVDGGLPVAEESV